MMDHLYTLLKFIVAGGIIVGVTYIARYVDPKYGGILAAAPITTTLAILFTSVEIGHEGTRQLVMGSFYFALPSLVFLLALFLLMGRLSLLPAIGLSYLVWLTGVILMQRFIANF